MTSKGKGDMIITYSAMSKLIKSRYGSLSKFRETTI